MARQTGVITYTGKLGNTVGYQVGEDFLIRMMPEEVKRTRASKRAALDFGTASKAGRLIRHALFSSGEWLNDRNVINRLNKVMGKVVRMDKEHIAGNRLVQQQNLTRLEGFSFNADAKAGDILRADIKVEKGRVIIPSITTPKHTNSTTHIEIKITTLSANFVKGTVTQTETTPLLIRIGKPSEPVELTIPEALEESLMVVLQVHAFEEVNGNFHLVEDRKHFAADIIAVILPEVITTYSHPTDTKEKRTRKRLVIRNFRPPAPG